MLSRNICVVSAVFLAPGFAFSAPGCAAIAATQAEASIQATAHVEPPLGLVAATGIDPDSATAPEAGNHLFYLYHPRLEGVQFQTDPDGPVQQLILLRPYTLASLVTFAVPDGTGPVTVTVVFTDN